MAPEPLELFIASYTSGDERRHGAFRALRAFYGWTSKRYDMANPMDKVSPPRRRHKEKSALSIDQLKQLLDADITPEWVKTLVWLLADTGCRIGEVSGLNKDSIGEDTIKVSGKTGERIVPISPMTREKLLDQPGYTLFPYGKDYLRHSVKKAFSQAGLAGSAHLLRHTFCSLFQGSDLALKDILGHTTFTMVNNYRHTKDAKALEEHHQHSPVIKIYGPQVEPQTAVNNNPADMSILIKLAEELGASKEKLKNLEDVKKKEAEPHDQIDFKDDMLNYLVNIKPDTKGSVNLTEAKFLYHAAMHDLCMTLARKQTKLIENGKAHAVYYLAEHGYLLNRNGKGSRMDVKEYLALEADNIVEILRNLFYCAGQEHWELATCYGKLCNSKCEPGYFDITGELGLMDRDG